MELNEGNNYLNFLDDEADEADRMTRKDVEDYLAVLGYKNHSGSVEYGLEDWPDEFYNCRLFELQKEHLKYANRINVFYDKKLRNMQHFKCGCCIRAYPNCDIELKNLTKKWLSDYTAKVRRKLKQLEIALLAKKADEEIECQ